MRTSIETTAVIDLPPRDLDNLVEELRAYHAIYSPLFQRREQREWAAQYLHGLLLELPRKSIEPLVLAIAGSAPGGARYATVPQ
jgi:SRSO17 transposase